MSVPTRPSHLSPFVLLVGANCTPASDLALGDTLQMAERIPGCELHVVRVVAEGASNRRALELARRLESYVARLAAEVEASVRTTIHVRSGRASQELSALAEEIGADVLVIGRSKRTSRVLGWLGGSFEERLLRRAPCAVLVADDRRRSSAPRTVIEPPCSSCIATRAETGGREWWCPQHAGRQVLGRPYHYRRSLPFVQHDSNVIPTGIDVGVGRT